jgi:hypothetical protein
MSMRLEDHLWRLGNFTAGAFTEKLLHHDSWPDSLLTAASFFLLVATLHVVLERMTQNRAARSR